LATANIRFSATVQRTNKAQRKLKPIICNAAAESRKRSAKYSQEEVRTNKTVFVPQPCFILYFAERPGVRKVKTILKYFCSNTCEYFAEQKHLQNNFSHCSRNIHEKCYFANAGSLGAIKYHHSNIPTRRNHHRG